MSFEGSRVRTDVANAEERGLQAAETRFPLPAQDCREREVRAGFCSLKAALRVAGAHA
jgi:hypothetical protein